MTFALKCVELCLFVLLTCPILLSMGKDDNNDELPNFVVFLADDLGIGDVGCFGNSTISTPNIDRLCNEGAKLTHLLADAVLCTPSRAAFLTGRHAYRMGLAEAPGSAPVVMYSAGRAGLPPEEVTWAKVLQNRGYDTMAVGKWHLGWDSYWKNDHSHGPLNHGFSSFFGLPFTLVDGIEMESAPFLTYSGYVEKDHPMHRHGTAAVLALLVVCAVYSKEFGYSILVSIVIIFCISWFFLEHFNLHNSTNWWKRSVFMERFLNSHLMHNKRVYQQPMNLEQLGDNLLDKAKEFISGRGGENKTGPFALYYAFPEVHTPLVPNKRFKGKSKHGAYGDSILELDSAVGQILDLLDEHNLSENTFVLFTSDHGCHIDIGERGGSNRPFSGGKGIGASEGGLRVPGIIRWPRGGVKPKSEISAPASLLDMLPTVADIVQAKLDSEIKVDGKSLLPVLRGETTKSSHQIIRHYCGTSLHAIRIVQRNGSVYKGYFRRAILNSEGHCGYNQACACHNLEGQPEQVEQFQRPRIYDAIADPKEERPLKPDTELYLALESVMKTEFELAESEEMPESQLSDVFKVMPMPWLQPCARFPLCRTY